jgi:hypothetical protein
MKLGTLIASYFEHPASPFHDVKDKTRAHYRQAAGYLAPYGGRPLAEITGLMIRGWHAGIASRGLRTAHHAMKMLRIIIGFGVIGDHPDIASECVRIATILDRLRFPVPERREQAITFDQASAIVEAAIAAGRPSIAIAQAFQFEGALRQIDVIGEWAPREPGSIGGIVHLGARWGGGLTASSIAAGVLRKKTTKTGATGEWDLELMPLVQRIRPFMPAAGPLVVSEETGRPYRRQDFAKQWRAIARAAGVPDGIWNMDSRAGGISEGDDAGADIEDIRQQATHTQASTTRLYVRRSLKASRRVSQKRIDSR